MTNNVTFLDEMSMKKMKNLVATCPKPTTTWTELVNTPGKRRFLWLKYTKCLSCPKVFLGSVLVSTFNLKV